MALAGLLATRRTSAGLSQSEVARRLNRPQSIVSEIEAGRRKVEVFEFLDLAEAIGFDAVEGLAILVDQTR